MKNLIASIVWIIFLSATKSIAQQNVIYFGEVRDSVGTPVQFANVMAIDTVTKEMSGFAVTDLDGRFKIRIQAGKTHQLKVTFIGYYPFEEFIKTTASNEDPFLIILKEQATQLGEVEIVAEMPVTIQGDTIIYKVEAFNQGNERKLGDVLEDLPGFQIEENGEVKVQGKKVNKVLIDGKEFFDGDSKLATKNIPANVVDRVQVLQNFNDVSPLRNVNTSEQLALNIELKEDKKSMVFGDITAGGGPSERYYAHANTFYYDEKTNLNLIADGNNIGELAFTMQDYFRFSGGLGSLLQRRGSGFSVSSDEIGFPLAERNTAQSLDNQLGAFNMSLQPTQGWQITGFAIGSLVDNTLGSISNRTYLQENGTLDESATSSTNVTNQSGIGKLALKYTPNPNVQLDYQIFARSASMKNGTINQSIVNEGVNDINGETSQSPWLFQQRFNAYTALGDKDVLSVKVNHSIQHQDPIYDLFTTVTPFPTIIPWEDAESPFGLKQKRTINTERIEALADYYHILNKKNHIQFSAGFTSNEQLYRAQLFQNLNETTSPLDSVAFRNKANFQFQDWVVGVLYKNKWKKLTWIPAINLHHFQVNYDQLTGKGGFDRTLLLPSFNAKYDIRSSQTINFSYAMKANFMDVQRVVTNLSVDSYNSLTTGNIDLTNALTHSFNVRYSNFNSFNFFNIYGGFAYERRIDDIQSNLTFNQWERINAPVNTIPVNENLSGYLNLEKRFDHFRLGADSRWTFSNVNNTIGDVANTNTNFQQAYKGIFSTRLWK
ncbi:MAG: carboxypeptidase-like regulatory domain-containing protein, partial [Bacteroidota bacterium]